MLPMGMTTERIGGSLLTSRSPPPLTNPFLIGIVMCLTQSTGKIWRKRAAIEQEMSNYRVKTMARDLTLCWQNLVEMSRHQAKSLLMPC